MKNERCYILVHASEYISIGVTMTMCDFTHWYLLGSFISWQRSLDEVAMLFFIIFRLNN